MLSMNFTKFTKYVIIYYVNFKKGNRQSAAIKYFDMQLDIEKLKYYLFETLLTIEEISREMNTSRYYICKAMKENNLERTEDYTFQVHSNLEKNKKRKRTPEQVRDWYNKVRQTKQERYNDPNYNNMDKNRQTKLKNHGDPNYNNMEKHKATSLERCGFTNITLKRIHDGTYKSNWNLEKARQTKQERYNDPNYNNPKKHNESMKRVDGMPTSNFERQLYEKLKEIDATTVCQKKLGKKKFDICIKDLIIEVNGSFYHMNRPYKDTELDRKEYEELILCGGLKENIAKTWKEKDPYKLIHCNSYGYRYLAIYVTDSKEKNGLEILDENNIRSNNIENIIAYIQKLL